MNLYGVMQVGKLGKVMHTQAFHAAFTTILATSKTSICVFFQMKHWKGFHNPRIKEDEEKKDSFSRVDEDVGE